MIGKLIQPCHPTASLLSRSSLLEVLPLVNLHPCTAAAMPNVAQGAEDVASALRQCGKSRRPDSLWIHHTAYVSMHNGYG